MTIWRVVKTHNVKPVVKRRKKSDYILYNKEVPGNRVQMDVTKLRAKAYQFTAIDDCTRLKTIRGYPNKKAESTIDFLHEMLRTFPFPILHLQTDWGTEFFNDAFQEELPCITLNTAPSSPGHHI
jgi:transposase InsO family protein